MRIQTLFREPLLQFIAIGILLFVALEVFAPVNPSADDPYRIDVDKSALLNFLQYQKKSFKRANAEAYWQKLDSEARESLIADYLREEVLYREALHLGLEQDDQIIRRRLIQKLEFVSLGFAENSTTVSEAELENYFAAHRAIYEVAAAVTFTHVFLKGDSASSDRTWERAEKLRQQLNANQIPFAKAPGFGDRFHYHRNYVERTHPLVKSHFGQAFADHLFQLPADTEQWQGPLQSAYGAHLVKLTRQQPARLASLKEVAGQVLADLRRQRSDAAKRRALDALIAKYTVRRDSTLVPKLNGSYQHGK